jgi:hypothetical protein
VSLIIYDSAVESIDSFIRVTFAYELLLLATKHLDRNTMVATFPSAKTLVVASAALALVRHVTLCEAGSITVMTYNTWNSNDGRKSCLPEWRIFDFSTANPHSPPPSTYLPS